MEDLVDNYKHGRFWRLDPSDTVDKGFHGTSADLGIGDQILPSNKTVNQSHTVSAPDLTYFVPVSTNSTMNENRRKRNKAWEWAMTTSDVRMGRKRPRVYTTIPQGTQYEDDLSDDSRLSPSQLITDIDWAPDPLPGSHVSQTLPHINWRQFNSPNWLTHTVNEGKISTTDEFGRAMSDKADEEG
jgi:hypothetical protein